MCLVKFICEFPFTSGKLSKRRPALVLFDLGDDALICRITSVSRTGPLEVALSHWETAGLAKPSVARLSRLVTAEKTVFIRRLGELGSADKRAVREAWNGSMWL